MDIFCGYRKTIDSIKELEIALNLKLQLLHKDLNSKEEILENIGYIDNFTLGELIRKTRILEVQPDYIKDIEDNKIMYVTLEEFTIAMNDFVKENKISGHPLSVFTFTNDQIEQGCAKVESIEDIVLAVNFIKKYSLAELTYITWRDISTVLHHKKFQRQIEYLRDNPTEDFLSWNGIIYEFEVFKIKKWLKEQYEKEGMTDALAIKDRIDNKIKERKSDTLLHTNVYSPKNAKITYDLNEVIREFTENINDLEEPVIKLSNCILRSDAIITSFSEKEHIDLCFELEDVDIIGITIKDFRIRNSILKNVRFKFVNMEELEIENTDIEQCKFESVNLSSLTLVSITADQNYLREFNMDSCNLTNCKFLNSNSKSISMTNQNVNDSLFENNKASYSFFKNINIEKSQMNSVEFEEVNVTNMEFRDGKINKLNSTFTDYVNSQVINNVLSEILVVNCSFVFAEIKENRCAKDQEVYALFTDVFYIRLAVKDNKGILEMNSLGEKTRINDELPLELHTMPFALMGNEQLERKHIGGHYYFQSRQTKSKSWLED